MHYKKGFIQIIVAIVVLLVAIGAFVAIVDPYQQYRQHEKYLGNQRLEIAGVARHHDYNAVITGSSMAMNHYPSQVDSLWDWKSKNFSIMGATDDDYAVILPYVISQGKVKHIILALDFFSFARQRGAVNEYLYNDNIRDDYEYLWNYTSLKNTIQFLRNPLAEKELYHFNSPVGYQALADDYNKHKEKGYEEEHFDLNSIKERFDSSLYNTIKQSSNSVEWLIYFPPYSIGEFMIYDKSGVLNPILESKKYMIKKLEKLPNVKVYDFQKQDLITRLDQYMDLRHHSHAYNRNIMEYIHDDRYRATADGNSDEIKRLVIEHADSIK